MAKSLTEQAGLDARRALTIKEIYMSARRKHETAEDALQATMAANSHRATQAEIETWWLEQDWEGDFTRKTSAPIDVVREETHPQVMLEKAITQEKAAYQAVELAEQKMRAKPGDKKLVADWASATDAWRKIAREVGVHAEKVRTFELEIANQPIWQKQWEDLVASLKAQYRGQGPHYNLLCEDVADIAIRLRRIRQSERTLAPRDAYAWHHMLHEAIKRLQMYTESTKVETTKREVNAVTANLLNILETIIKPENPALWEGCVLAIRRHMRERRREELAS